MTAAGEGASVAGGAARVAARGRGGILTRIVSGSLLAAVLLAVLFIGGIPLDIAVGGVAAVGMWEVAGLARRCGAPPTPWILYPLGEFLVLRFLLPESFPALEWGLGAAVAAGLLGGVVRRPGTDAEASGVTQTDETVERSSRDLVSPPPARAVGAVPGQVPAFFVRWAAAVGAAIYIGLCLGYYLALMRWHPAPDADRFGLRIVIVVLAAAMLGDTAALFTGRTFGRHPFFPRISPRKTIEGAAGGALVGVLVVALLMPPLVGLPWWQAGLLGVAVAVMAQGGDLAESAFKRAAGAKDSSSLIPGHGGLLDRLDSLLLLGPVVYSFLRLAALP